jgi:hypothetical protein
MNYYNNLQGNFYLMAKMGEKLQFVSKIYKINVKEQTLN